MEAKKPASSHPLMTRKELADYIFAVVFSTGPFENGDETYSEYDFPPDVAGDKLIAPLVSAGCDRKCLLMVLDKAVDIYFQSVRFAPAKALKSLAHKMRRIAKAISKAEVPGFLTILGELSDRKRHPRVDGPSRRNDVKEVHGMFMGSELAWLLEDQASLYEEWILLAADHVLPKDYGTLRLARVCVAWYVKFATGKTYFPEVLELLRGAGLGNCSTTQLSRELQEFESDYPRCYAKLKIFVQRAPTSGST